jgi:hypothetical protein
LALLRLLFQPLLINAHVAMRLYDPRQECLTNKGKKICDKTNNNIVGQDADQHCDASPTARLVRDVPFLDVVQA